MMKLAPQIKIDYALLRPDEQIPAHEQRTWELTYIIVGRGTRIIGDTTAPFSEGEVILVPPGMRHQWVFNPAFTDMNGKIADAALFIAPELLNELAATLPEFAAHIEAITRRSVAVRFEGGRRIMIQKLMKRLAKARTPDMQLIYFLSLLPLLGETDKGESEVGHPDDSISANDKKETVRIYCECNYMKRIALADCARHLGMNVSSFCKFFKRNFRCSFTEYINHLRINQSCRLLKTTTESVADIAYTAGFSSVPYFNRVFRHRQGCTPLQYRSADD